MWKQVYVPVVHPADNLCEIFFSAQKKVHFCKTMELESS